MQVEARVGRGAKRVCLRVGVVGSAALTWVTEHDGGVEGAAGEAEGTRLDLGVFVAGASYSVVVVLEGAASDDDTPSWWPEPGAAGDGVRAAVHEPHEFSALLWA